MNKTFQIVLLLVFGVFVIIAVIVFAVGRTGSEGDTIGGEVTVWGTFPEQTMNTLFGDIALEHNNFQISYVEKGTATFEDELVQALASGRGPDLAIIPHTMILAQKERLKPIPFTVLDERTFSDTFIDAG